MDAKLKNAAIIGLGIVLVIAGIVMLKQTFSKDGSTPSEEGPMEITDRERRWMNNKLFQFWRFIVLNLKILKAVDHSKRA